VDALIIRKTLRVPAVAGPADLDVIVDQLWGACYHRLLVLKVPFDESITERLVDHALYGSAPREADHPRPVTTRRRPADPEMGVQAMPEAESGS
jgi:hypothetical protein